MKLIQYTIRIAKVPDYFSPKAQEVDKLFKRFNEYTYAKDSTMRLNVANGRRVSEILIKLVKDFTAILTRQSGGDNLRPELLEPYVYLGMAWTHIFERLKKMTAEVCRLVELCYSDPNNGKEAGDALSEDVLQLLKTALRNVYYVPYD